MIIYQETKHKFLFDIENRDIDKKISNLFFQKMKRHTSQSEINSWKNSLEEMYWVVKSDKIPNKSIVTIEYNLPASGKRVDFIISGKDINDFYSAVLIELKQWTKAEAVQDKDAIVTTLLAKNPKRETVHPSYQIWSYLEFIKDFSKIYHDEELNFKTCAFLHNYEPKKKNEPLLAEQYKFYTDKSTLFFRGETMKLTDFIAETVVNDDDINVIKKLDNEDKKPTKSLQDMMFNLVKGNEEFTLLDTQKLVYEEAKFLYKSCLEDGIKRVLIVEGGPGTGKSVLAIQLLTNYIKFGYNARYVSKNSSVRQVYTEKLIAPISAKTNKREITKTRVKELMVSSGEFVDAQKNSYDVLIIDEAHRLMAKSGMYQNKGDNQIKEIIKAAKLSIFFIDDNQVVTSRDIGTKENIKKIALESKILKSALIEMQLESQFRMNGSDGYLSWIDNILGIKKTANIFFEKDFNYDFRTFKSIDKMYDNLKDFNDVNNKTRFLAGYCWQWKSKKNINLTDINLSSNFNKKWNLNSSNAWAIRKDSFEEIGCIHTSQGIEFDYTGVIIGPDLKVVNGELITDPLARSRDDASLKGLVTLIKKGNQEAIEKANKIILNTYRVLLTRAMKGCYVFFTDEKVRLYFEQFLIKKD